MRGTNYKRTSLVSFTPGRRCHQVNCQLTCGCQYGLETFNTTGNVLTGCQTKGNCLKNGKVSFKCNEPRRRKEIRDLTPTEWSKFHLAIRNLSSTGSPSKWAKFSELFSAHSNYQSDKILFLPWLRYYIHQVESALQDVDCDVTIPYFDWTIDAGSMMTSQAWQANAFGGNGGWTTDCVMRHPFKVG